MKCLRLGIGMVLMNFALLAGVVKADVCDEWQRVNTEFGRLDVLLVGIEDKREDLQNKVKDLKAKEESVSAALEDDKIERDRINQTIAGLEIDLPDMKAKLRALEDIPALQARVDEAYKQVWKADEDLVRIEAVLASYSDISEERRKLAKAQTEFEGLFGKRSAEDVISALNASGWNDMLQGTMLDEIKRVRARRGPWDNKPRVIDENVARRLEKLSEEELNDEEEKERGRLKGLAEQVRDLPAKIGDLEKSKLTKIDQKLREDQKKEKSLAEAELTKAIAARDSASVTAKVLRRRIDEYEGRLKEANTRLAELNQKLAELDKLQASRKGAEAEISRLQAEEARIGNELARLTQRRSELETKIEEERGRLNGEVDKLVSEGRKSSNRAQRANRRGEAEACRDSLVAAMASFNAASNLAMQKQGCLGSSAFAKVEADIQTAQKIQCGGRAQQTELIEVPTVNRGRTREDATLILTRAGFSNISFTELEMYGDCADKGKVTGLISPAPGEKKPPETLIQVGTYNDNPCVKEADTEVSATQAPGGGWDAAADKAQVSAKTISADMSRPPTDGPTPSSGSQVDQANEVAKEAIKGGPQDKPILNPEALVGVLGTAAGIAGAAQGGSRGPGSVPSPSLTRVPGSPLPGVTSPMGTPSRIGSGLPGGGIEDRRSSPACEPYFQKLNRLRQTQEQLVRQATAYSRDATSAPARQNACRLADNTEQIMQTVNAAKSAGCSSSAQASSEALSYQLKQWKALCSGGR